MAKVTKLAHSSYPIHGNGTKNLICTIESKHASKCISHTRNKVGFNSKVDPMRIGVLNTKLSFIIQPRNKDNQN